MTTTQLLRFPINNWGHLYSLQKAISHHEQQTGSSLKIHGKISNHAFLTNPNTQISINFLQVDETPNYSKLDSGQYELGLMAYNENHLETHIKIDKAVFNELRKNLIEYADIEGIHIMISLGLLSNSERWLEGESLQIVQLDYAMKGD